MRRPRWLVCIATAGHGVNRAGVKPARTMSTSCRKSSTRKWRNFTFQQVLISKGEYDEFGPTIDIGVVTMSDSPSLLKNYFLGVKVEGPFNGGDCLY